MAASLPNIWAAGDCASTTHLITGKPFWVALGTVANKMGRTAGISMGGGRASFGGVLGTAMSKHCSFEVARTGLTEKEAAEHGFRYASTVIKTKTRAGYYPGAEAMHVKLVAEEGTGRLLGGQIVGGQGAAKRVDILAAALTAKLTVKILSTSTWAMHLLLTGLGPSQTAGRSLLGKMGGEWPRGGLKLLAEKFGMKDELVAQRGILRVRRGRGPRGGPVRRGAEEGPDWTLICGPDGVPDQKRGQRGRVG